MTDFTYQLPVWETITTAWEKIKGTKATIWACIIIVFIITGILAILSYMAKHYLPGLDVLINFISQIIAFLLQIGMVYIGIQRAYDLPITYSQMFRALEFPIAIRLIAVYIIEMLMLIPFFVIGICGVLVYATSIPASGFLGIALMILGVIGGIYLTLRFSLSMGFVIDKISNPLEAIKLSFIATRSNVLPLLGIVILEMLILLVSLIPLGIGLIWTLPFIPVLFGVFYKNLSQQNLPPVVITSSSR